MGRVIMPCGTDAKTPYRFVNPDVLVYSIEELCYILKENAFLMDTDIMDKRLAGWIDTECGLKELSALLYPLINQKGSVSSFVLTILDYTGNYSREEMKNVENLLKQSANLSAYEKMKTRVDYMVGSGKYKEALFEYDLLLSRLPREEQCLSAKILHNKGVALTGLFLFAQAADCFLRSFELLPEEETYIEYLAAVRMQMSDSEYISFVAERPQDYELSLELERRMEALSRQWEESLYRQRLSGMQAWKAEGENMQYYDEAEKIIQGMKHGYRVHAGE